jgi:pimeloyl-ACP methyl ester carboxylesterase
VHGFPTCSYDYRHVLDDLAVHRRVLVLDLLGFGLSEKPDVHYSIGLHADIVQGFVEQTGVRRMALLTHDMGDTVGGELLARQHEGQWPVEITRRVLTNGSIYIEMAHLTAGQELLLSLPDRAAEAPPDETLLRVSLAETMAPASGAARADLSGDAALVCHRAGNAMLTRTIRYIEDRRAFQARFTGSIERHPSPLTIIWGTEDPIAVVEMAERLAEARPDATVRRLPRVGHYPMLEAPGELLAVLEGALS